MTSELIGIPQWFWFAVVILDVPGGYMLEAQLPWAPISTNNWCHQQSSWTSILGSEVGRAQAPRNPGDVAASLDLKLIQKVKLIQVAYGCAKAHTCKKNKQYAMFMVIQLFNFILCNIFLHVIIKLYMDINRVFPTKPKVWLWLMSPLSSTRFIGTDKHPYAINPKHKLYSSALVFT